MHDRSVFPTGRRIPRTTGAPQSGVLSRFQGYGQAVGRRISSSLTEGTPLGAEPSPQSLASHRLRRGKAISQTGLIVKGTWSQSMIRRRLVPTLLTTPVFPWGHQTSLTCVTSLWVATGRRLT